MSQWPSLRWPKLRRVLTRKPLQYRIVRQSGSHKTLDSEAGYPRLHLAFHDNAEIPGGMVKKILVNDVGLTEEEARSLV